ncbi:MAG: hypothetical protein K5945_04725 [Bacteroidaceae bacterium]|nr:hypothetical protein [Bacteroidaceae bacterium]
MRTALLLGISALAVFTAGCRHYEETDRHLLSRRSPIEEPYAYVSGGAMTGKRVAASPDPLVAYEWHSPKATDRYQIFVALPREAEVMDHPESFRGVESATKERCRIRVTGPGAIRLDFGTELPAWIEIDSPDLNGDVELGFSEHREYAMCPKIARPAQYGNTYRMELNKELYEGVRYGFIRINRIEQPFTITAVRAVAQVKPLNYTGSFDSDNELINKVWYTGAWDVKANLREDSFGAIMFDRGDRYSWTGDAYTAQWAALAAFSCYDEVFKNLHWTDSHPNGIETYEIYWVESLIDYYMYSGDEAGLRELLPKAEARLAHTWEIFDQPHGLTFVGWDHRLGTGFDHPDCPEGIHTFQMLAIGAWKHLAAVLDMIGEQDKAAHYRSMADEKTPLVTSPAYLSSLGMHSSADAINADLLPDLDRLYHKDFSDRLQRQSFSSFNQCFILQAMAHAGHYGHALASVIDHWGGQIEWGGTCFFEVFRHDWPDIIAKNGPIPFSQAGLTSMAHPWGAGVTSWLSEEMLGIKPLTGGFRTFQVKPHLAGYATRVSGQTMTPHGPIRASFDLQTGHHSLTVPEGTTAMLYIPKEGMEASPLPSPKGKGDGLQFTEADGFLRTGPLAAGEYEIRVKYSGSPTKRLQEDYHFATTAQVDTTTHGVHWMQKYGKDGYYIVGGGEDATDLSALPDYVEWLAFDPGDGRRQNMTSRIKPLHEDAVLPVGREPGARKAFACYYTGGCQCNPLKVKLRSPHPYTVTLYMADCDHGGRDVNVEAFDLDTGNRISPEVRIPRFEKGAFVTFRYDRSICIYANAIRGDNAVYNAVFFD